MARKPRVKSGTGIYHVMLRGVNKQDIFEDEDDFKFFRRILYNMVFFKDDQWELQTPRCIFYAYCLMTNHVHLLIREAGEELPSVIKRITVSYAMYYNNKYQHSGHLFQNRFRSEPVNDSGYFFTLLRYIHQNPVAASIVTTVDAYRWSSWHEYENDQEGPVICTINHVLRQMPLSDLRKLVFELLPKASQILDFDNENRRKTDDEVKAFLLGSFGLSLPTDLQIYSHDRRQDILRMAKQYGASLRQLERLTGISINIIRTA